MRQISQSQIHDYLVCPWRYYLKNIRKLTWPEPVSARYQELARFSRLGKSFHQFVHRFIQGITFDELEKQQYEPEVAFWIRNFRSRNPLPSESRLFSEVELSAIFEDILWIGYVDAIAVLPERAIIFDWKTSKKAGDPIVLQKGPQTRLYCFLLNLNKQDFFPEGSDAIPPEKIEMVYWYPNVPAASIRLPYSNDLFQQDQAYFRQIAGDLSHEDTAFFPQTADEDVCRTCRFQTYCRRGLQESSFSEEETDRYGQEAFDFMQEETDSSVSDTTESPLGPMI